MIKRSFALLYFTIKSILFTNDPQEQISKFNVPDLVMGNILQYLSTEQILKFREVNKQAQKVAEFILSTDLTRRVSVNLHHPMPASLIKKISSIELELGDDYIEHVHCISGLANNPIEPFVSNISHIKALSIKILKYVCPKEKSINRQIIEQLHHLEVLSIQHPSFILSSHNDSITILILQALPLYTHLKKIHIDNRSVSWEALLQILPKFDNLRIVHIKGNRPYKAKQLMAFIQALQKLTLLQKLCFDSTMLDEQETDALANSLATLSNMRTLNLRNTLVCPHSITLLKQKCPHISQVNYTPLMQ